MYFQVMEKSFISIKKYDLMLKCKVNKQLQLKTLPQRKYTSWQWLEWNYTRPESTPVCTVSDVPYILDPMTIRNTDRSPVSLGQEQATKSLASDSFVDLNSRNEINITIRDYIDLFWCSSMVYICGRSIFAYQPNPWI